MTQSTRKHYKDRHASAGGVAGRSALANVRRWALSMAVAVGSCAVGNGLMVGPLAFAANPTPAPVNAQAQVASVEQLKSLAFEALRGGHFDVTNELLVKAASISDDPSLSQMATWTTQYETQREGFVAERRKQYDKAVADVMLLLKHHKDDYAVDLASRAYLLADDKARFNDEPWVKELIAGATRRADEYEAQERWLKALRLYSDLGAVEPANPVWKEKLKLATRRIRLLAMYVPDDLKAIQKADSKDRDEVDALLHPSTQPATNPLTDDDRADPFRVDWHETLKGIQFDMLRESLVDARERYWRPVTYRDLMLGGIDGLRAVLTTKGLDKAFPGLKDTAARQSFLSDLDQATRDINAVKDANDASLVYKGLAAVKNANQRTINLPEEVWVSEFADGAFTKLDPFSSMIWPSDVEEFNKTTQGEFSGVGIQIQTDPDGSLKVVSPLEDSPAYKAGIKAGDVITRINGNSAKGITVNQAVKTITGVEGTPVVLTIRSPDATVRDYTLIRQTIKVASIKGWMHKPGGGWDYFVDPDQKIGYLRITNFTKTTGDDLSAAVDQMKSQGARALIMDLRYNPGGLLNAATEVVDKFLTKGVIVSTRPDRPELLMDSRTEIRAHNDGNEFKLPVVVLVNQYSASASEIVSGALKDDKRALIVGERTFGKGSVQMLFHLGDHNAYLKLTTSHYYLPNGKCIHREENSTEWGVDPDVTVEMTPEQMSAAIAARQVLDVLHSAEATPADGAAGDVKDKAAGTNSGAKAPATQPAKGPLQTDPQLSAALLLLRLQLVGARI